MAETGEKAKEERGLLSEERERGEKEEEEKERHKGSKDVAAATHFTTT